MREPVRVTCVSSYRPALAWFAAGTAGWAFVLVLLGAFTTSIGAGMVFADWPLSNGSLNPAGWLQNIAMFSEHAHRLSVGIMSALTLWLAGALWRCEERRWLRRLGWIAVALLIGQAVVGGLRVLLNPIDLPAVGTNVGQLFAMLHACLAQTLVCVLVAIAAAVSRPWIEAAPPSQSFGPGLRQFGRLCCGLLLAQLAIAAVMRHRYAGLAIPTFPLTPDGRLVPAHWDFAIAICFAHRVMTLVLAVALGSLAAAVWRHPAAGFGWKGLAWLVAVLLAAQIVLGVCIIWSARDAFFTTAHVVVGALTLSATFVLTLAMHRNIVEGAAETADAAASTRTPTTGRVPAHA